MAESVKAPLLVVLSGPGGVGKGTLATALIAADPKLTLSRSWATRPRRKDDVADAYVFVSEQDFLAHRNQQGFLEWNKFLDHYYGTPVPDPTAKQDLLLEIDVAGGRQVLDHQPDALMIFVEAPSEAEQRRRLLSRGDDPTQAEKRIAEGKRETQEAKDLGYSFITNDNLAQTVTEVKGLINEKRG